MTEKTAQKEPDKKPVPSKKPKPQQEVVVQIPLSELHPFPDHPFQVREDASMQETAESVKEYGVLVPALARPREDGGYELIAGHRRKHACELAGLATMPVIVRNIDRDAATIIMVDSNLQRENILPSERAKAYKMKMLYPDNAEEMVFEAEDIIKHDGMFGVTRPDWDAVKGHIPPRDVEQRFLNSPTDSMAIYQLRRDAPVELRFANLGSLAAPPDPANYEAVYTREVYPDDDTGRILENFYYIFNDERPGDFVGHSLSVSDIVALKQDGKVSYHYCDSMGFQELPAFQKPENYLKAAEMSMEDDYGMIDGIINNGPKQPTVADLEAQVKAGMSISLMDLAEAAHREKKKSVLEQLKSQPAQERPHKTAPKKSAEKEL